MLFSFYFYFNALSEKKIGGLSMKKIPLWAQSHSWSGDTPGAGTGQDLATHADIKSSMIL